MHVAVLLSSFKHVVKVDGLGPSPALGNEWRTLAVALTLALALTLTLAVWRCRGRGLRSRRFSGRDRR